MPNATEFSQFHEDYGVQIQALIKGLAGANLDNIVEQLNAMITAYDFNDAVLIDSSLNRVFEALAESVEECIGKMGGQAERIRTTLPKFWALLEECQPEYYQEIGEQIASSFANAIAKCEELRDGSVRLLQEYEFEIANAGELDREIGNLIALKQEVLKDWPWQNRELPAVDRAMVERSRAALARGESGIRIEDLIRGMACSSAKNNA